MAFGVPPERGPSTTPEIINPLASELTEAY